MSIRWQEKFPDMKPINSAPGLGSINGFGMTVYGERDRDAETGTYVTTHCLILLFVPVFCVGAYRVANADYNSYYFVGKEPLSMFAKMWNGLVLCSILGIGLFIAGNAYLSSDDYVDGRKLAKADALAEEGKLPEAAETYRAVAVGKSKHKREAVQRLAAVVQDKLDELPAEDARRVLRAVIAVGQSRLPSDGPDLLSQGMELADRHGRGDPLDAMRTFEIVEPLGKEDEPVVEYRQKLVERIVETHPTNAKYVIPFAENLHEEGEIERCRQLLEGVQDQLGSTEGARILGQMLAREGRLDEAHALLVPYTEARLKRLHNAEEDFNDAYEQAQNKALARLRNGTAVGFSFDEYESATEEEQSQMVNDYLMEAVRSDSELESARLVIMEEAEIVPTALDLGIVILRRAQAMDDPDQRQTELEQAEKTFLAIRGVAGETDEYRLFLGQVYYWLDKQEEGQELFNELLAANERSTDMLTAVGSVLREVGDNVAARDMIEEAYESATSEEEKYAAAQMRALMAEEPEDEIEWLKLADPTNLSVQASLSTSLGRQAAEAGDDATAERHYGEAIETFAKLPETAASLNNSALAYLALYRVNGKRETLDKVVRRIDKAIALSPSDSILLSNASSLLMQVAMEDIIGDAIDFRSLKLPARISFLGYLYNDQQQHDEFVSRVCEHEAMQKAVSYMDKLLVLAPKQLANYQMKSSIHSYTADEEALAQLVERFEAAKPDVSESLQSAQEYYLKTNDEELLADSRDQARLLEKARTAAEEIGGTTLAVTLSIIAAHDVIRVSLGEEVDMDEIVRKSEEAQRIAPSLSTERGLISTLLFRADSNLAEANSEYRDLRDKSQRTLNASDRIALTLAPENSLREVVLQDPDVDRALSLLSDSCERISKPPSAWDWAVLRSADADRADEIAELLTKDRAGNLERKLDTLLSPASASAALRKVWQHQTNGEVDSAQAEVQRLASFNVGLPLEP